MRYYNIKFYIFIQIFTLTPFVWELFCHCIKWDTNKKICPMIVLMPHFRLRCFCTEVEVEGGIEGFWLELAICFLCWCRICCGWRQGIVIFSKEFIIDTFLYCLSHESMTIFSTSSDCGTRRILCSCSSKCILLPVKGNELICFCSTLSKLYE